MPSSDGTPADSADVQGASENEETPLPSVSDDELFAWAAEIVVLPFHAKIGAKLREARLDTLLSKKNPYLFAVKPNMASPEVAAKAMLDAYLSSSEETVFGNLLETLAIKVNNKVFGGYKAPEREYPGIDLIFERDDTRYYVCIKSGANWANSSSGAKLKQDFASARGKAREGGWNGEVECINGCLYGRSASTAHFDPAKPDQAHKKVVGPAFWLLVSGQRDMYQRVLRALEAAHTANEAAYAGVAAAYGEKVAELAARLRADFTQPGNPDVLDMKRILEFNSRGSDAKKPSS